MKLKPETPEYDPKNLQIIFYALLGAQIFFLLISLFSMQNAELHYHVARWFYTVVPLCALALDVFGTRYFNATISKLSTEDLQRSFQKLAMAHLVRWALVEAATVLLIGFAMYFQNHFFNAFALVNILYFSTLRPRLFTFNEGY